MWRERARNSLAPGEYKPVSADCRAERRRRRPQHRLIDADEVLAERVRADLKRSRTPRQIGRLLLEATDASVDTMDESPNAAGRTVSHEAIYRWIYALSKGELAQHGILLRSRRTARQPRKPVGERGAPIVGTVSIDDRPETASDRRLPGSWEGNLIIGAHGKSAAVTLVGRSLDPSWVMHRRIAISPASMAGSQANSRQTEPSQTI